MAGCKSTPAAPGWPGALCEGRFESSPPPFGVGGNQELPPSRLLVEVGVQAGKLEQALEQGLPERLVERERVDLGDAGRLLFSLSRQRFRVRLEDGSLSIGVRLAGRAEVCKPVALLGCVAYGSCALIGQATVQFPLELRGDLGLPLPRVQIPVTEPCKLSALGLDLTDEAQGQANRQADEIRRRIKASMPAPGPLVEGAWRAMHTSIPLGGAACARLRPRRLVQSRASEQGGWISFGFGVEGEVSVHAPCEPLDEAPPPTSLPPLERIETDPRLLLALPQEIRWSEVDAILTRSLAPLEPSAGRELVHVTGVRAGPADEGARKVRLVLTLAGRWCGAVALDAEVALRPGELFLREIQPAPGEALRVGASVDLAALGRAIEGRLRLPLPAGMKGMHLRMEDLVKRLVPEVGVVGEARYRVQVQLGSAQIGRSWVGEGGLIGEVQLQGKARVELEPASTQKSRP
jgi:hypothetical protein